MPPKQNTFENKNIVKRTKRVVHRSSPKKRLSAITARHTSSKIIKKPAKTTIETARKSNKQITKTETKNKISSPMKSSVASQRNVKDKMPCISVTNLAKCKNIPINRKLVFTFQPVNIERKGNECEIGQQVEEIISSKLGLSNAYNQQLPVDTEKNIDPYAEIISKKCGDKLERSKQVSKKITSGKNIVGYICGKTDFQSDKVIIELKHANDNPNHYRQAAIYAITEPGTKVYLMNTLLGQIYQIQKGNIEQAKLNMTARAMSILNNKIVIAMKPKADVTNPLIISYAIKKKNNLMGAIVYDTVENCVVDVYENSNCEIRKSIYFNNWLSKYKGKIITWNRETRSKEGVIYLSDVFQGKKLVDIIHEYFPTNNFNIKNNVMDISICSILLSYVISNN